MFCNELSRREGLSHCYSGNGLNIVCNFAAKGYRLPTEAEWEYACRAGTETDFQTGNMTHSGSTPLDPALDRAGWYDGNSGSSPVPVGEKKANAFGLYDMHGNVNEWCWDWSGGHYPSRPVNDPRGPTSGTFRIQRGGSWYDIARDCRSASRDSSDPSARHNYGGFRVVRTY